MARKGCRRKRGSRAGAPAPQETRVVGTRSDAELAAARGRELSTKLRGELTELLFYYLATKLGFVLSKPFGDSQRYDFVLDNGKRLFRIQVKCTTHLVENNLYHLNAHRRVNGKAIAYTLEEIDFFAAYVIPDDSWFILPLQNVLGCTSLMFRKKGDRKPHVYDRYREAWELLREPAGLVIL